MSQLVFVYNADGGRLNALLDLAHKTLAPATYACSLCAITYGVRMRPEWKAFLEALPVDVAFLHRDEFKTQHPALADMPLPAVFIKDDSDKLTPFITAQELNQADLAGLMQLIRERLNRAGDGFGHSRNAAVDSG